MIALPNRNTDEGLKARVLLAECRGPSFPGYALPNAKICVQYMALVLSNRMANPTPFAAKQGTLQSIVTAPGQFAGFEHYPAYSGGIKKNIQDMLDIANNSKDKRSTIFAAYIQMALDVAKAPTISDPTPGKMVAWRTAGSGSPGTGFNLFCTMSGASFYYQ
jgi:hypothetical protein